MRTKRHSVQLETLRRDLEESIRSYKHLSGDEWLPLRSDYDTQNLPSEFVTALRALIAVKRRPSVCAAYKLQKLKEFRHGPLQSFDLSLKIVHVGGTNGKGSVANKIAYGLRNSGLKVGLLTSPHLISVRERTMVDGQPIRLDEWMGIHDYLLRKSAEFDHTMPWFEFLTVLSMLYFWLSKCEYAVCEVGLGGRKDSTNVFPTKQLSVITSIGLDHMEILGDTPEKIAHEKAGIIKPTGIAILGPTCRGLSAFTSLRNSTLVFVPPHQTFVTENNKLAQLALSLLLKNVTTLNMELPDVPGRFELLGVTCASQTPVILDVGHNVSAIKEVAKMISYHIPNLTSLKVLAAVSRYRKLSIFDPLLTLVGADSTEFVYLPCSHELLQKWGDHLNDGSDSWKVFSRTMATRQTFSLTELVTDLLGISNPPVGEDRPLLVESDFSKLNCEHIKSLVLISGTLFSTAEILEALKVTQFSPIISKNASLVSNTSMSTATGDQEQTMDCLWTFRYEIPRIFTSPVVAHAVDHVPSLFFVKSRIDMVHEALTKQSESVWYSLNGAEHNLDYPEGQHVELLQGSWVKSLQVLVDAPILEASAEKEAAKEPPAIGQAPPSLPKVSEGVNVYVEGVESSVMEEFLSLVAKGIDSLTGSKRKYVEVEMNLRKPKVAK